MRWPLLKRKILNTGAIAISYVKLLPDLLRMNKNSLVIDCGANVGHISKLFSLTGAQVIAFEPDPIAFARLRQRCGKRRNVTCIQKGVWDRNSRIELYRHQGGSEADFTVGSSIIAEKVNVSRDKTESIEVIDLVAYLQQLGRKADLIKLDVEGAEIEILKKILETDGYHLFGRMYVETHENKIPTQKEDLDRIKATIREKHIDNIKLNWV